MSYNLSVVKQQLEHDFVEGPGGSMSNNSYKLITNMTWVRAQLCQLQKKGALNQQYLSYIMATSFSGGRSRSTLREPPTMGKQLVNSITCCCELSAPFFCN
jgi:hypothetical protein